MTTPMVAPSPEWFRSVLTGEPIHVDDLTECDSCLGHGELPFEWRSAYTGRMVQESEPCPDCRGVGKVEGYGVQGRNYAPRPVEPLTEPRPAA